MLARQGLPHPDPAVRAAIVARRRRWYRLAWYPTILGCLGILAVPVSMALASTSGDWRWYGAAPLTMLAAALPLVVAFWLWITGVRAGWLAAPNLPEVPPATLPLRVPSSLPRSPLALVAVTVLLMVLEWIVIAITVEPARPLALAMVPIWMSSLAPVLILTVALRLFEPPVIIEAEGMKLPSIRLALSWEQVAEIRSNCGPGMGLAILPHHDVILKPQARWWRHRSSPWLFVQDVLMTTAVETVVSTAIHARSDRLQVVGEVDGAGRAGADA